MLKLTIAAAAATVALTGGAFAADLSRPAAPVAVAPVMADASSFYVDLLGGAALAGTVDYSIDGSSDGSDDLPVGGAVAAALGYNTGFDGLSTELDLFYANRDYSDGEYNLTTASVMGTLKYTVSLTDTFGLFGAVGLGGIYLNDKETGSGGTTYINGWGLGYQVQAGVTAKLTDSISLLAEYRYENSFSPIAGASGNDDEQSGTNAVLVGAKFGF